MRNHDFTHKGRLVPDRETLAILVDQGKFLLVEKNRLAAVTHQPCLLLTSESRREIMLLGSFLSGHTFIYTYIALFDRFPVRTAPGRLQDRIVGVTHDLDLAAVLTAPFPPDAVEAPGQVGLENRTHLKQEIA